MLRKLTSKRRSSEACFAVHFVVHTRVADHIHSFAVGLSALIVPVDLGRLPPCGSRSWQALLPCRQPCPPRKADQSLITLSPHRVTGRANTPSIVAVCALGLLHATGFPFMDRLYSFYDTPYYWRSFLAISRLLTLAFPIGRWGRRFGSFFPCLCPCRFSSPVRLAYPGRL